MDNSKLSIYNMDSNDNKTIYNFTFVDRDEERKKIEKFINNNDNNSILIIRGKHGVGKTELINYLFKDFKSNQYIYVEKLKDQKDRYIDIFFNIINQKRPKYFNDYCKKLFIKSKDYVKNSDFVAGIVNISALVSLIVPHDEIDSKKINNLTTFIDSLYENGIKIIILDNFAFCEEESKRLFLSIFNEFSKKNTMKFIIVDIDDDDINRQSIDYCLDYFGHIRLDNLSNSKYFYTIFDSINKDKPITKQMVDDIFKYCKGNFFALADLLRGCLFNSDSNYILNIENLIRELHYKRHRNDEYNSIENFLDKGHICIIIMILFWFGKPLHKELIYHIFKYICNNFNMRKYEETFNGAFNALKDNNYIHSSNIDNNYYFKYDNDIIYLKEHIDNTFFYKLHHQQIASLIVKFINENQSMIVDVYDLTNEIITDIKIHCMALCNHVGLVDECVLFGNQLYERKDYKHASYIFDYIKDLIISKKKIHKNLLEKIAETYYFVGQYSSAKEVIESYNSKSKEYYYFKAKIYNILLEKQSALNALDNIDTKTYYKDFCRISHMKIVILLDSKNGFDEANNIFNNFYKEKLKKNNPKNHYEALMLTNAFNFLPHNEAKQCMLKALNYFESRKKSKEDIIFYIGMTYHNLGSIIVRKEGTKSAEEYFQKAIKYLESSRSHELSYTYNNLAYISILNDDYTSALDYLSNALLYNNSEYAFLAIRCNQLICYCMLKTVNIAKSIVESFENAIETRKYEDNTINRKLIMNIIFYYMKKDNEEKIKEILNNQYLLLLDTSSAIRYNKIITKYNLTHLPKSSEKRDASDISLDKDYEAWCITINHD